MIGRGADEHDGILTGALAEVMGYLRRRPYDGVTQDLEQALEGAANEFVSKLASHLKHEEEVLFPALRRVAPDLSPELERLAEEHRRLRAYAAQLGSRLHEKDREGAYATSRAFLAALFDHIDRERKTVDDRLVALKA